MNLNISLNRLVLVGALLLHLFLTTAQSEAHPILDRMDIYVASGKVYVSCVVSKGYTCFGIELKRSVDSMNYETVDIEYGVCGSDTEPTYFSFEDSNPPLNQRLLYRLDLGGFGYTKTLETRVVDVQEFGYRITPNPASDFTEIHFSNINKNPIDIAMIDLSGNVVMNYSTTNDFVPLNLSPLNSGFYVVIIENKIEKRIVKGKLVVVK